MSHTFGPKNDKDSVPYLTVFTILLSRPLFLATLYLLCVGTNASINIAEEYPCKTLNFCCSYTSMVYVNRVIFIQ